MTGTWNPAVINNTTSGSYTFTPAGGQCGIPITIPVTIIPRVTPTFSFGTSLNICAGGTVPTLPNTSTNGITGTWSPAVVDDQNPGTYTFTPNAGQCANPTTFTVTVTPNITPTFSFGTSLTICAGGTVPALPTTSTNGITGTWSPAVVDNQNSGTYTFTPTAGQCALPATFTVTVDPNLTPTFSFGTSINLCAGGTVPTLPTTSTNGITGIWNPAVVDNQNAGVYTFTPTAGQCAVPATLSVTITPNITPTFTFGTSLTICAGGTVPALPTTSNNGITGVWSPAVVSNTTSGVYTFTPTAGQCATTATFTVTVNPIITPSFDINTYTICAASIPPVLPTISLEGITGTWNPAVVDNQNYAVYTFTPNPGQCAITSTVEVYVLPNITPTFNFGTSLTICAGGTVPVLPGFSNAEARVEFERAAGLTQNAREKALLLSRAEACQSAGATTPGRSSVSMRPSTRWTRRSMRAAMSRSCVTATTVLPRSRTSASRIENTCSEFWLSRLPVGSSARMMRRIVGERPRHRRRAGAGRPRAGRAACRDGRRARADCKSSPARSRISRAASRPSLRIGSSTFSRAVNSGSRKWNWKTKPSIESRVWARSSSSMGAVSRPPMRSVPLGRPVEQAEQIEQRRFAGAGRAGDGDELLLADAERDVPHQRDRHRLRQDAGEVLGLDQGAHVAPLMMSTGLSRAARRAGR